MTSSREAQRRLDVAVLGRDDVNDGRSRQLADLVLEIGVGDRLEQDLQVEGEGDERLRHRLQKRALDILVHVGRERKVTVEA